MARVILNREQVELLGKAVRCAQTLGVYTFTQHNCGSAYEWKPVPWMRVWWNRGAGLLTIFVGEQPVVRWDCGMVLEYASGPWEPELRLALAEVDGQGVKSEYCR